MSGSQYHGFRRQYFIPVYFHPGNGSVFRKDIRYTAFKPYFAAQTDDFLPHIFNHIPQDIRTDVGLVFIKNGFRCTEFHKQAEHLFVSAVFIFDQCI